MRLSCDKCPRRGTCTAICEDIKRLIPGPLDGPRAGLKVIDRSVAWRIQDHEDELTPRQRLVARLHHRFGLPEAEIADLLGVFPSTVCQTLKKIRKRIAKAVKKTC